MVKCLSLRCLECSVCLCCMTEELCPKEAERPDSWRSGTEANSRFFTSRYLLCFHLAQHYGWGREKKNEMGRSRGGKETGEEKGGGKGRNKNSASTRALSTSPAHHWHPWATASPGTHDPACEIGLLLLLLLWGSSELRFPIFSHILQLLSINCNHSKSSYNTVTILPFFHALSFKILSTSQDGCHSGSWWGYAVYLWKSQTSFLAPPYPMCNLLSQLWLLPEPPLFTQRTPDIQMKREPTWVACLCTPGSAVWLRNCSQQLCHGSEFASSIHNLFLSSVGAFHNIKSKQFKWNTWDSSVLALFPNSSANTEGNPA